MGPSQLFGKPFERGGDRGAALVVALFVMVICALLGAAAIMTSTTDLQISAQDRVYHRAFANADAAVDWLLSQNLDGIKQMGTGRSSLNSAINDQRPSSDVVFALAPPWEGAQDSNVLEEAGHETTQDGGQFPIYSTRVDGMDLVTGGRVRIQVEMRVPPVGEVDRPSGPSAY